MTTILITMDLHDYVYTAYIIRNGKLDSQTTIEKDDVADFALQACNTYDAHKITLNGNDLLTGYYAQKIKEKQQDYAIVNLVVERTKE